MAHPTAGVHPLPPLYLGNPFARAQFEHLVDSLDRAAAVAAAEAAAACRKKNWRSCGNRFKLWRRWAENERQNEQEHGAFKNDCSSLATNDEEKTARARKLAGAQV